MDYVARCTCGWGRVQITDHESAEIAAHIHEETAGKLRPHEHETLVHREDE